MEGEVVDEVLSMVDVLQEDNELEEEANAVLGDSDDQCCTYSKGYVNRQALYACNTCTPTEMAGVCLACCLTCHDGHELYELYTKRNFRCDCGNSKFGNNTRCKLYPDKDAVNSDNKYNQNFRGLYCTCHKPYPDPDDEIEDEMIQCIICEDWYHSRHLGSLPPANYQEMICDECTRKCFSFLQAYLQFSAGSQSSLGQRQQVITKAEKDVIVDVGKEEVKSETKSCTSDETKDTSENSCTEETKVTQNEDSVSRKEPLQKNDTVKEEDKETNCQCKLLQLQSSSDKNQDNTTSYWAEKWRSQLCSCNSCKALYESNGVSFLLDDQDTMAAYEERGKVSQAEKMSTYESGMQALGNMQRINQVEAIHGYNDLKNELTEYLREFADQGKVVTPEDIRSFFDTMQSRKRQRVGSASTIQYQCK